jgi:excisionase family DNA binding protein
MPKYYTPEEVALELRVTRRTVYEWLTSGRLRGYRAGTRWRVRPEDVQEFLQPRQQAQDNEPLEARAARIRAARGALAHVPVTVEEVLRWKREEVEREHERWAEVTGVQPETTTERWAG